MSRILRILIIAVVALVLTAPAWPFDTAEVQQVRELLYKEKEGWYKGDPDLLISCYAEGFVSYGANQDPELWSIDVVGLDTLRAKFNAVAKENAELWVNHPKWSRGHEVLHIQVKGDHAIATTQHWEAKPDSTARETIFMEGRVIRLLVKEDGEWKIISNIGGINARQKVWKWNPE